jgi:hypothetical protein
MDPPLNRCVITAAVRRGRGGDYWAVASWYVTGTDSFASKLIKVEAGKSLTGVIKLLSKTNSLASYSCEFTGLAKSKLTVNSIAPLVWLAEVLEVYSVDTCTDYPNTPFFRDVEHRR